MAQIQATTTPGGIAAPRCHLVLAAEARRRGDHAADAHEDDALLALRATLAPVREGACA